MKTKIELGEKGQSLIFFALLLFAFIVLLALVIDGGNTYFQRRNAQNAADAGALAGTRNYCEFKDVDRAKAEALKYVLLNEATLYEPVTVIPSEGKVNVKTEINFNTFLGNIVGRSDITAVAEAESGCEQPCLGEGVLPVVWICKPSGVGGLDCDHLKIDSDTLDHHLYNPTASPACTPISLRGGKTGYLCPELTIVMDNIDVDTLQCSSSGGVIDCDFDGDTEDDYISAENRGWADLDGDNSAYECAPPSSEGASELTYWITDGYQCPFFTHTWVGDQSGSALSIFTAVEQRRITNPYVILPIFDDSCPNDPRSDPTCTWHAADDVVHDFSAKTNYYHVNDFSLFYITCVQTQKGDCPAATAFYDLNKDAIIHELKAGADYNAIEGYFIKGYVPGLKGGCGFDPDLDVFTVHLNK